MSWGLRVLGHETGSMMLRTRQALGQTWSGWVESLSFLRTAAAITPQRLYIILAWLPPHYVMLRV